jgi:hypothetical protein
VNEYNNNGNNMCSSAQVHLGRHIIMLFFIVIALLILNRYVSKVPYLYAQLSCLSAAGLPTISAAIPPAIHLFCYVMFYIAGMHKHPLNLII